MELIIKKATGSNLEFLNKMLFEAVYWRASNNKPSFDEGILLPEVSKALEKWHKRPGDLGVFAFDQQFPVGAAWIRYWNDKKNIRGYYHQSIPVLVIGVHPDYRHQGVGSKLLEELFTYAKAESITKISLCVSKDNVAYQLYIKMGFVIVDDIEDSYIMIKTL